MSMYAQLKETCWHNQRYPGDTISVALCSEDWQATFDEIDRAMDSYATMLSGARDQLDMANKEAHGRALEIVKSHAENEELCRIIRELERAIQEERDRSITLAKSLAASDLLHGQTHRSLVDLKEKYGDK